MADFNSDDDNNCDVKNIEGEEIFSPNKVRCTEDYYLHLKKIHQILEEKTHYPACE